MNICTEVGTSKYIRISISKFVRRIFLLILISNKSPINNPTIKDTNKSFKVTTAAPSNLNYNH